jgi:prophage tail gpP-like protein
MSEIRLEVSGRSYSGWKSVRVTRSMDTLCGSFELSATDRWSERGQPMAIKPQDACRVLIDDDVVIDGYVDARPIRVNATTREQGARGRDRAMDVADSSAFPESWVTRNVTLLAFAQQLCAPHSVSVSVGAGVVFPEPPPKFVINPGDTVFQVLSREAQSAGVLLLSDGAGGLVFARSGTARALPLKLGVNVKSIDGEDDDSGRHHRYIVLAQRGGSSKVTGRSVSVRGEAIDEGVRRTNRVHVSRPMSAKTAALAQQTADWAARRRAGMARTRTATVGGWRQRRGDASSPLWVPNELTAVDASAADLVDDRLIAGVTYSLDGSQGEITTLRLVHPDTFAPDPTARVRA